MVDVERRGEEVGQAVAGEVVEDAAAGQVRAPRSQADSRSDVLEPAHVELRAERVERDQIRRRDLFGVLAQRHVRDVQQPADPQVAGVPVEVGGELLDRLARARLLTVNGLGSMGKMQLDGPTHSRQFSISPRLRALMPIKA